MLSKADRSRIKARNRQRRYRERKEEKAREAVVLQEFDRILQEQIDGQNREVERQAAEAAKPKPPKPAPPTQPKTEPVMPPVPVRTDPFTFNTAHDKYRPSWWDDVDRQGAVVTLTASPKAAFRHRGTAAPGLSFVSPDDDPNLDPGMTFNEADGHRDEAAEQAKAEAEQEERNKNVWR